jgi:Tol biopolymer transport system component
VSCRFRPSVCVLLGLLSALIAAEGGAAGTERASVDSAGVEGEDDSFYAAISPNGRYVAFVSRAPNLVPGGATDEDSDVFVHDRKTGVTECISLDPSGVDSNGQSSFPALSANGRFVAFESGSTNLVANDLNTDDDVFLRDRKTGAIERLSVDAAGMEGEGRSHEAAISASGRFVAFQSEVPTLVAEDENLAMDIFVRDRKAGTIERVSLGPGGSEATGGASENPAISANGRYVAFDSAATDLVGGDGNALLDVFVHDRKTGVTERVSVAATPVETDGDSRYASISGNGRYVAFQSNATNLVEDDGNGRVDAFVYDRKKKRTTRVSVADDGTEGDQGSFSPAISANGRIVAFEADATTLVAEDENAMADVFAHDRKQGVTTRLSVDSAGAEGSGDSYLPAISGNGRFVAFESGSPDLVPLDGNASKDVFVRDRK